MKRLKWIHKNNFCFEKYEKSVTIVKKKTMQIKFASFR